MTVNFIDQEAGSEFLEDLLEQAMLLYTTVQGTCPGNRDFGITPLACLLYTSPSPRDRG